MFCMKEESIRCLVILIDFKGVETNGGDETTEVTHLLVDGKPSILLMFESRIALSSACACLYTTCFYKPYV